MAKKPSENRYQVFSLFVGSDDAKVVFRCEICNEEFDREILLQSHQNFFHNTEEINHNVYNPFDFENIVSVTFNCQNCDFTTEKDSEMIEHHIQTHFDIE